MGKQIAVSHRVDGSAGPWVTFITGIANDYSMWDRQAAALASGFRVLCYDLPGQGGTAPSAGAAAIDHPARIDRLVPCCCRARMVPEFAALWHELIATVKAKGLEPIVEPTL